MLNWIEKTILKRIHKKLSIKLTKENLVLAFTDLDGNGYYKFAKGLELPISRMSKLLEYMMWLRKGTTKEEYLSALEIAKKGLEKGISDGKGLAKMGFVITELENRAELVIHDELFYNILAVQHIRHDESVTKFNNEIHLQKVEAFRELDKLDDCFFLNIQEFLQALNLQNITKTEYENLMSASRQARQALELIKEKWK